MNNTQGQESQKKTVTNEKETTDAPARPRRSPPTPERLAFLRTFIHRVQPWLSATGPKTPAGKARSSRNALKHGIRCREAITQRKELAEIMRLVRGRTA